MVRSAGILPFRRTPGLEVLLAHPGGPFWASRDEGAWGVVKGLVENGESDLDAARREFEEETGWRMPERGVIALGEIVMKSGKRVVAWAVEADFDPATLTPGTFTTTIGGREVEFPEIDRVEWCDLDRAADLLIPAQHPFLTRLESALGAQ